MQEMPFFFQGQNPEFYSAVFKVACILSATFLIINIKSFFFFFKSADKTNPSLLFANVTNTQHTHTLIATFPLSLVHE